MTNGDLKLSVAGEYLVDNSGENLHTVEVKLQAAWAVGHTVTNGIAVAPWQGFTATSSATGTQGIQGGDAATYIFKLKRFERY